MVHQSLRPADHSTEVIVASLLEYLIYLCEGENGENLVVDVGQLDSQLLGGQAGP